MADNNPYDFNASKSAYADLAGSAQATAGQAVFDESKGAAGRVNEITSNGGPLMAAARTRAKQASTKYGLQNSSTALQAGEQAVIETATPIAQTDASLYNQTQIANANNSTQASIANANLRGQIGIAGLTQAEQGRQFDATYGFNQQNLLEQRRQFDANLGLQKENLDAQREQFLQRLGLDQQQLSQQDRQFLADLDQKQQQLAQQESQFTRDQQNKVTLANLDAANRERLIQIEAGYKTEIAGNENISRAWGTMMDSINQIQNNADLEHSTKNILVGNARRSFESFANFWKKTSGGTVDVSDLLDFSQSDVQGSYTPNTPNGPIPDSGGLRDYGGGG